MPTSIDPQSAENEFECANCGAYFHYELTRCPNCGVNLYEPDIETDVPKKSSQGEGGVLNQLKNVFHNIFNRPYSAEDIFGNALDASILYNDLLTKVGGDRVVANRLIEFEHTHAPNHTRKVCIENAIRRLEKDNQHQIK